MAFTFTNYANPELSKSPLNDIISNLFGGYEQGVKASYLQPSLAEELKKSQLENKWYEPNMQSQIGLRGAQAGHLGSLTQGQNITNKFLPQTLQNEIELNQARAQKAIQQQELIKQFLSGEMPQNIQEQKMPESRTNPIQNYGQGLGMFPQRQPQLDQLSQLNNNIPQPNKQYAQAALISQMLGFGQPKITDVNGKQLAIGPLGVFDTGVQGLNEEQKAFQAGLGKNNATFYKDSIDNYNSLSNQGLALEELKNAIEKNPQFRNVVGPIKKPLASWFGSPEQKQLLGDIQTASGEIALQVAPSLKGAWTGRDQTMINGIKAGPQDFPDVFIGKLKSQIMINDALKERADLQAKYIEQGKSMREASKLAAQQTPLSRFEPKIKELTTHHEQLKEPNQTKHLSNEQLLRILVNK
jgi:hypothetical protein